MKNRARLAASLMAIWGLSAAASAAFAAGPDVTVFELGEEINNYGTSGGVRGYSLSTESCNAGDQPLNWCTGPPGSTCGLGTTNADHPVIAQNLYRIKNGRFEQIGVSWLKHGFYSVNAPAPAQQCGSGPCVYPPLGPDQLGVGCTDPYTADFNGNRPAGRRSQVNAATGEFPYPYAIGGATAAVWNQRLAVAENDLSAAANPGALYYAEGQYVAPDDAMAGNGLNNASSRRVSVLEPSFDLETQGPTRRRKAAIEVWPEVDPAVELLVLDAPTFPVERFYAARKVEDRGGGTWRYSYAVHNLNSQRAARRLAIVFAGPTRFTNAGFHDVDRHSGEPYDNTDWRISASVAAIAGRPRRSCRRSMPTRCAGLPPTASSSTPTGHRPRSPGMLSSFSSPACPSRSSSGKESRRRLSSPTASRPATPPAGRARPVSAGPPARAAELGEKR